MVPDWSTHRLVIYTNRSLLQLVYFHVVGKNASDFVPVENETWEPVHDELTGGVGSNQKVQKHKNKNVFPLWQCKVAVQQPSCAEL